MTDEMRVREPLSPRKNGGAPCGGTSALGSPPLTGRVVAIVHPAWHSCGSHQVFVSQAQAYRSLGAKVVSLAIADTPGCVDGSRASKVYIGATGDLEADTRLFAGMPLRRILNGEFLRAAKQWLHGNDAAMRVEIVRQAAVPGPGALAARIDLIHCNHFFCMPAAVRLREKHACPILLDTHDLQARQYALRNRGRFRLPRAARYEDMLEIELDAMRPADLLIHLNDEEAAAFKKLVPDKPHALLYPTINAMPPGLGGGDPILVASANYPNFLGLRWFLEEVLPLAPGVPVQILGNIDRELRSRAPDLYKEHAALFRGRVEAEDLHAAYRGASAVLLPATAGHGISIKSLEALSCGAPLIATPLAFRGLGIGVAGLPNVTVTEDAAVFAQALWRAYAERDVTDPHRESSATRKIYEQHFAFAVYRNSLCAIVEQVLEN
ncbi:MAG TPA: glycosyltransferase [Methylocella sp.]|nr:glycosyltransferase [Methylocella sp.]